MFQEGGVGASVKYIESLDNRCSGLSIGHQLRKYLNGTKYTIKITGDGE